ncbi:MAG TPA: adenylate/guanylate cyclase domain-containing protein [Bryobacteraceae bacterium]|nr:adenylate/guanylate cyclase domain-containing protein [Bryobacteraceae bacterium]
MGRLKFLAYLALVIFSLPCPVRAIFNPEAGAFVFRTYSAKDYSANIQNWSAVQDSRGILYFGNNDGILSYDSVNWRLIPMPNGAVAQSLARGVNGAIYVGGSGEFGYLETGPRGLTHFVSLLGRVPGTDRHFGRVWDIISTPEGIYFGAFERIFRLNPDNSIQVFHPKNGNFSRIFRSGDHVYVHTAQDGFLRFKGNGLLPGPSDRHFTEPGVVATCQLGADTIIASGRGLYRLVANSMEPFHTEMDAYLREHQIYTVFALRTGDIAVGTHTGGLVLLTNTGQLDRLIDEAAGAPSNGIVSLYADRQGGVWLTTDDSGIARFDPSITRFGAPQGIDGILCAIDRYNGSLYAGSNKGLYRLNSERGKAARFELFQGFNELVGAMMNYGAEALIGAQRGLYTLNGPKLEKVLEADIKQQVWDLAKSNRDAHVIYGAGRDGVFALRQDGQTWKLAGRVSEGEEFRTVAEDSDGRVWATTIHDIWRMDFSSQPPKAERFTAADGVPTRWKNVYRFNGHIVFATQKGLMTFAAGDRRFVPDAEAGMPFADGSHGVSMLGRDPERNVWITGPGYNGTLRRRGENQYAWTPMPLLGTGIQEVYCWDFDRDGVAWASGASGDLYRWNAKLARDPNEDFAVQLESVKSASAEYGGPGSLKDAPTLPYQENELTFAFAAPSYEEEPASANKEENGPEGEHVQYQFRLAGAGGKEREWSKWSIQTQKDLNNLWEHSYSFEIRARNAHGVVTPAAVFHFKVLPPWYRTWWAYLLYLAATIVTGWRLFRWRVRILQENNRRLEQTVEERTIEVRQQRDQNEALLLNILPKPVAAELSSTGAVTPMTFDDVTVCFTDFVGFTLSSENLPAETLVTALNEYFTAFDEIMGRYGLEKLKTIGDSYMFVSGLPEPRPSHAVDAVLAALEMVEVVRKLSHPGAAVNWKVRVGLFSGPVVAGVVGVRKFAFDIWGNTVNFAARMESSGAANRVNLSAITRDRVREFIECEARGLVKIKEGREMEMYFALGPSEDLLQGDVVDGMPEKFRQRYEEKFGVSPRSFPSLVEIPTA